MKEKQIRAEEKKQNKKQWQLYSLWSSFGSENSLFIIISRRKKQSKGKPKGIKNDDDEAANSRFGPTTRMGLVEIFGIGTGSSRSVEEAGRLGNVRALAVVGKLRPSEQKASGE